MAWVLHLSLIRITALHCLVVPEGCSFYVYVNRNRESAQMVASFQIDQTGADGRFKLPTQLYIAKHGTEKNPSDYVGFQNKQVRINEVLLRACVFVRVCMCTHTHTLERMCVWYQCCFCLISVTLKGP